METSKYKEGDIVSLKAYPKNPMVVGEVSNSGTPAEYIECVWLTNKGKLNRTIFKPTMIDKYIPKPDNPE